MLHWLGALWASRPAIVEWSGAGGGGILVPVIHVRLFPEVSPRWARVLLVLSLLLVCSAGFVLGCLVAPYVLPHMSRFQHTKITPEALARARHVALLTGGAAGLTAAAVLLHLAHSADDILPTTYHRTE
jgi:hypothetical protein